MKVEILCEDEYVNLQDAFNDFASNVDVVKVEVKEFGNTDHVNTPGYVAYHVFYNEKRD